MIIIEDLEFKDEMLSIWQNIQWRLNSHLITPQDLALKTTYSKQKIEKGLKGEHVVITLEFLNDSVIAFGLASGRKRIGSEMQSWEECIRLLKPSPEMPPRQGNFWEDKNSDFE